MGERKVSILFFSYLYKYPYKKYIDNMQTDIITIMDADIRNTTPLNSDVLDARISDKQSFYLVNTLDQNCSCQLQVSGDKTNYQDVGSPVVVTASTGIDWIVNSDAYPWLRIEATAAGIPTSGSMLITANKRIP